jgi:hypothetical protein
MRGNLDTIGNHSDEFGRYRELKGELFLDTGADRDDGGQILRRDVERKDILSDMMDREDVRLFELIGQKVSDSLEAESLRVNQVRGGGGFLSETKEWPGAQEGAL